MILSTSLVAILGLGQAGSAIFWKLAPETGDEPTPEPQPALPLVACFAMLFGIVALAVLAGPVMSYIEATAQQLHAPEGYIAAVLNGG